MFSRKNTFISKIFPVLLLLLIAGILFAPLSTRAQVIDEDLNQEYKLPDPDKNSSTGGTNIGADSSLGGNNIGKDSSLGGTNIGGSSLPSWGPTTIPALISKIFDFLLSLAIPFAVLMIVFAGFKFITAQGNEEKITQARKNLVWTIIGLAVILAAKIILGYIEDFLGIKPTGVLESFISRVKSTLNSIIVLLFALATIYFIWGVIEYIKSGGEEEKLTQGKRHMVFGIIGMAVMASAWGIVAIVQNYIS